MNSTLDFGPIDLIDYSLVNGEFLLKGKIHVKNLTDKFIVVVPYNDRSTHCDKRYYQIIPNGQIEINYWSFVKEHEMSKPINRNIKILNSVTKEKQVFTFKAEFEQHAENRGY